MAALDSFETKTISEPVGRLRERKPSEIAKRRKLVKRAALAAIIASGATGVYAGHQGKAANRTEQPTLAYTVKPGDTIWTIADRISPDDRNLRAETYDIERHVDVNAEHPNTSAVQPGDKLLYHRGGSVVDFIERGNK